MDFLQLFYFKTVAETNHITKAAKQLHISQPALSQMTKKLEKELSVSLFQRQTKGVVLTDEGELFLEYAAKALKEKEEIFQKLSDTKELVSGEILIQANAVSYLIAGLFCDFQKQHPHTRIKFVTDADFRQNIYHRDPFSSIHLFVTTNPPGNCRKQILLKERLVAALPLEHPLSTKKALSLSELREDSFLIFQGGELQELTETCCRQAGFSPNILMECHNTNILFNLVASGMGVSLFPESWKTFYNHDIHLVPLREPFGRTVFLCWDGARYLNKAADLFRKFLEEQFQKQEQK